jgi:hypothetical protein
VVARCGHSNTSDFEGLDSGHDLSQHHVMRAVVRIAALLLLCGCSGSNWLSITRPLADAAFARRCAETAGVIDITPVGAGGVVSDNPNLGANLWVLFDAGADFVEFERRVRDDDHAFVAEWSPAPPSDAIWRLERKPAGDPACATFDRWLNRMTRTREAARPITGRWLSRAAYRGQCLSVAIRDAHGTPLVQPRYEAPVYYLREDGAPTGLIGSDCYSGSDRRSLLVDEFGRRILELRTLVMRESNRCIIALRPRLTALAACGDPTDVDLIQRRVVFYPTPTEDDRMRLGIEDGRCGAAGLCWRQPATAIRKA